MHFLKSRTRLKIVVVRKCDMIKYNIGDPQTLRAREFCTNANRNTYFEIASFKI
jgi:hypothetical protein